MALHDNGYHKLMRLLNRVPCVPTCQKRANISFLHANVPKTCHFSNWRTNVPKACQHFIFTCQRANMSNTSQFSNWRASVPKARQHFIFMCQRVKDVPLFTLECQHAKRRANFSNIFQKKKCFKYG